MNEKDEKRIISDILNGDAAAYAILVRRYQKQIFNLMIRLTSNEEDAMDLTQETFIKAYNNLKRFKPSGRFFPWLYTIGMNVGRDFLRKKKIRREKSEEIYENRRFVMEKGIQERDVINKLDAASVQKAMEALPEDYREALYLRYHEEMPIKEIAACLNISVSGAKMRIHRGLSRLRDIISGETT